MFSELWLARRTAADALWTARASERSINFKCVLIGARGEEESSNPTPLIMEDVWMTETNKVGFQLIDWLINHIS